jgi:hypothetical protein
MAEIGKVFEKVIADKIRTIPGKARVIETAREKGRLLAVRGSMDYVQKVLPYCYAAEKVLIDSHEAPPDLRGFDALFIGCPGSIKLQKWEDPLMTFLHEGGVLLTTDWCLKNVVQKLFPQTVRKKGTAQGRFPLRVLMPEHPLLAGISDCAGTPWVVEGWSHRILVQDPQRVQVILDAPGMGDPSAVMVAFEVGKGVVVHAISHFHLQGSDKSGEYVSAYILTNVIDEAMRRRHPEPAPPRIRVLKSDEPKLPLRIRILNK